MIEIRELEFSAEVVDKLLTKHSLTVEECRQAFTEDPDRMAGRTKEKGRGHGRRVKIVGRTRGGKLLLGYLHATEDPARWRLATAWEHD